jgi:DNA polymerase I-like protein with 3'-5' exonuclease and polymerase domains
MLPLSCRTLIASFVGFGSLLRKCPALASYFESQQRVEASSAAPTSLPTQSNPLFLVSRGWSYAARLALMLAWRKGGCTEWRLLSEIMQNSAITKVAVGMKNKLVALRERDVVVEGPLADPSVAHTLLRQCQGDGPEAALLDAVTLQIPSLAPSSETSKASAQGLAKVGQKIACFRAVAVFRAMARLETLLSGADVLALFRNIEMALQYSASDAEYCGLAVDTLHFTSLRHNLSLRQELIEQYFATLFGAEFNVASPGDVAQLKRKLLEQCRGAVQGGESSGELALQQEVKEHPLMRLVSEHRSHTRLLPLCSSILGSRYFTRVRAVYNTLGTETGRVILTNPPLQQVTLCFYPFHGIVLMDQPCFTDAERVLVRPVREGKPARRAVEHGRPKRQVCIPQLPEQPRSHAQRCCRGQSGEQRRQRGGRGVGARGLPE